jgi:hypothetical protein
MNPSEDLRLQHCYLLDEYRIVRGKSVACRRTGLAEAGGASSTGTHRRDRLAQVDLTK